MTEGMDYPIKSDNDRKNGSLMLKHEYGKLLSLHTSLKIGGPAFCWLEPENFDDILECISVAESSNKLLAVVGKGSNILVQDKGFDGVAINLDKGFGCIEHVADGILRVGAGTALSKIVTESALRGLEGCEFLSGIPGSFGGALFMNAGVRDANDPEKVKEIKDIILDVDILDFKDKKRKTLEKKDISFTYRSSSLDGKCILGARIKLEKDDRNAINNRIGGYLKKREWIKGLGFPSAGSVFKNPDGTTPAGRLIESCGLKERRIGGAEISGAHANFILNIDRATSKDVLDLIELARLSVKEKFGVELELELRIMS